MRRATLALPALAATAALVLAGCSTAPSGPAATGGGPLRVVAAENFWGSIAAQLGGDKVQVTSIIASPDADPHDYEATASDGRSVATADMTIVNGVGYDTWASDLAAANPSGTRTDLDVGDVVGAKAGDNPHRWYNPADVSKVVDAITADYQAKDPADSAYYDQQKAAFAGTAMKDYDALVAGIKAKYSGTPIGASESIVSMIAPALGLDVLTPPDFLTAVSEGTDPTAADKSTIDTQISTGAIKVYVYNSQNATPDVQAQVDAAKAKGIPVSTITETMTPATASWEDWQSAQLTALQAALDKAATA
jgi:zinc/manganese transport system substrate-binding protein